ncbi:NADH-quinone oxidoreductase chain G [Gordonia araii NBRC 100433]|uniref:NADH-quinone oxidoreductase n=1 Tax=Gordonia araii NBRC 100433 TaxID=1073574 RepID=G7GXK5_9ACTN|nr:NADH-quinone oxidoreductase subunit G [Gordonia araii]NNG98231.1 NADH-quinone oxidoreductase subunit G [Gordonia araii NBRC 100433]GAB08330.1 NADH-quinone oxidoreductase chain G [Gordonia araii NBRC 100433]
MTTVETNLVTLTIDGQSITVPKGTLVIRAAEMLGIEIPRFCDHPLLDPVGACRQCLVDVEGQRKPLASCTTVVADDMVVRTQATSPDAARAQHGVMELLLINHPLDCPTCDKGGECPLQNQAMTSGSPDSRFDGDKRRFTKPVSLSAEVLLDRERCVLCARCTRFASEIAGDPLIDLSDRGALQQVSIYEDDPFDSYFSGNTVQICPVGALTNSTYRFRARPFDLASTPSVCEHCAGGCAQRTDERRGKVLRRLAGDAPQVNEEWNCDKGRWAFAYADLPDRLTSPLVRGDDGELHPASWPHAIAVAAAGLTAGRTGVLVGGRATVEDAYAYGKFARTVLGTNDIDFRSRAASDEEADFLAHQVAGAGIPVAYTDLESAPIVVLAGLEPEEESPMIFLRLRKAARAGTTAVYSLAPWATRGLTKLGGTRIECVPGAEAAVLAESQTQELLATPGAILLVGERLALSPGALTVASTVTERTGARLAWVPRRAGERGAADVGALPNLLPGGRPVTDPQARDEITAAWGTEPPEQPGLATPAIIDAAARERLHGLLVGGVEIEDLPDVETARAALNAASFVVSLEQRPSTVTEYADVVFPVAAVAEKPGTFVDWEGRPRAFEPSVDTRGRLSDHRVLDALAAEAGFDLGCGTVDDVHAELQRMGAWSGKRADLPPAPSPAPVVPNTGHAILASWRLLLDCGRMQDGEPNLAATARAAVARLSPTTAAQAGVGDGDMLTVTGKSGAVTLPLVVTDMPDGTVWLPMNSTGSRIYPQLGTAPGDVVALAGAESAQ